MYGTPMVNFLKRIHRLFRRKEKTVYLHSPYACIANYCINIYLLFGQRTFEYVVFAQYYF